MNMPDTFLVNITRDSWHKVQQCQTVHLTMIEPEFALVAVGIVGTGETVCQYYGAEYTSTIPHGTIYGTIGHQN